jgi:hypothetical protein
VQDHLATLAKMLPRIVAGVRPIVVSKPIPRPVLCYSVGLVTEAQLEKFKAIFLGKGNKKARNNIMEILQIDEWKEASK